MFLTEQRGTSRAPRRGSSSQRYGRPPDCLPQQYTGIPAVKGAAESTLLTSALVPSAEYMLPKTGRTPLV